MPLCKNLKVYNNNGVDDFHFLTCGFWFHSVVITLVIGQNTTELLTNSSHFSYFINQAIYWSFPSTIQPLYLVTYPLSFIPAVVIGVSSIGWKKDGNWLKHSVFLSCPDFPCTLTTFSPSFSFLPPPQFSISVAWVFDPCLDSAQWFSFGFHRGRANEI